MRVRETKVTCIVVTTLTAVTCRAGNRAIASRTAQAATPLASRNEAMASAWKCKSTQHEAISCNRPVVSAHNMLTNKIDAMSL